MPNFVEDPEGRWREIEGQIDEPRRRLETFRYTYGEWIRLCRMCVEAFPGNIHPKIDNAFQCLNELTCALLASTDELINAHEDNESKRSVLQSIDAARATFHTLNETAAAGLLQAGKLSQDAFVKEYGFYHLKEDLLKLEGTLQSERLQSEATCCGYQMEFDNASNELENINHKLREYDDMNFIEQAFNTNPHGAWDPRKHDQERLREDWEQKRNQIRTFEDRIKGACRSLQDMQQDTSRLFTQNIADEHSIIDTKQIAANLYDRLYDMEVCIVSTEVKLGIEDALRHVLKLTYTSVKMVDDDDHVKEFKKLILGSIADKFGFEKTEELKKERKVLDLLDE